MKIIGITGGSGAGKSTVTALWRRMGAVIIDADAVYRETLAQNPQLRAEIAARFGDVFSGAELDRGRLAEIVFTDRQALLDLNAITHKYVIEAVWNRLRAESARGTVVCVLDAIYLLETDLRQLCNHTVAVTCPAERRVARLTERDGLTEEQARQRVRNQKSDEYYAQNCDFALENTGDREALERGAKETFHQLI
ncbi:MAG: dephospho-CoA kinase [Oscillospiraceae bacterium]|nr:dephospho-CoA kinase [Oscillospiraceae bacterium]